MSIKVMGQVWELALPHQEVLVLLALADHADHEGKHVRPSLDLIAWKTSYSKRQVIRILQGLEHRRLIRVHRAGGGRGRATEYTLHLENGDRKSPFRKGDPVSTFVDDTQVSTLLCKQNSDITNSDKVSSYPTNSDMLTPFQGVTTEKTVTFATQNSDIAMSPQPSLEPKDLKTQEESPPPNPLTEGEGNDKAKPKSKRKPESSGRVIQAKAQAILGYLNTVHSRAFENTSVIEALLRSPKLREPTLEDCKLVIDYLHEIERFENPDGYKRYVNHITPFRPDNFERHRERAREWHADGRPGYTPEVHSNSTRPLSYAEQQHQRNAEAAQEFVQGGPDGRLNRPDNLRNSHDQVIENVSYRVEY